MNTKEARRQAAIKKAQKKKTAITGIVILAIAAVVALIAIGMFQQRGERVFVARGNLQVTLRRDGSFSAILPHGVRKSGTYTEVIDGDVTIVTFTRAGHTEIGTITGNVLTIPLEWDDDPRHGHPREYTLR